MVWFPHPSEGGRQWRCRTIGRCWRRCPPNVTLSPASFAVPKPRPKKTTFVPTGPLVGSTRILGINFRNGVADFVLDRSATRPIRQGIGRSQSDDDIARHRIRGNFDFDHVVFPAARPDDHVPDHDIVDSEHRIGVARAGRETEMCAGNLDRMAWFDLCRRHRGNRRLHDDEFPGSHLLLPGHNFNRDPIEHGREPSPRSDRIPIAESTQELHRQSPD